MVAKKVCRQDLSRYLRKINLQKSQALTLVITPEFAKLFVDEQCFVAVVEKFVASDLNLDWGF